MDLTERTELTQKIETLQRMRRDGVASRKIDLKLLLQISSLEKELKEIQENMGEFQQLLDELTEPPYQIATLVDLRTFKGKTQAVVSRENQFLMVNISPELTGKPITIGQEVYLTQKSGCIIALGKIPRLGDTAVFERDLGEGRILVRYREGEQIFKITPEVLEQGLAKGDVLLCRPEAGLALEKLPTSSGEEYFSEEAPKVTFGDIGGLDAPIEHIKRQLIGHFSHGHILKKYGQKSGKNFLLEGRPGNGKTMIAQGVASFLQEITGARQGKFISIKPGQLNSMWFGETERQIRELFKAIKKASAFDSIPVVVFFDELDSLGTLRGSSHQSVNDRIQTAFFSELDGFEALQNTVLIGATNRRDLLDPALIRPGRFGDSILTIPKPGEKACTEIFGKHLPLGMPYSAEEFGSPEEGQERLIQRALRYTFESYGASPLGQVQMKNGHLLDLYPSDLLSGAVIAQICQAALEKACWREIQQKDPGIRNRDIQEALIETFHSHCRALRPHNIGHYMDLPSGVEPVSVTVLSEKDHWQDKDHHNNKGK